MREDPKKESIFLIGTALYAIALEFMHIILSPIEIGARACMQREKIFIGGRLWRLLCRLTTTSSVSGVTREALSPTCGSQDRTTINHYSSMSIWIHFHYELVQYRLETIQ